MHKTSLLQTLMVLASASTGNHYSSLFISLSHLQKLNLDHIPVQSLKCDVQKFVLISCTSYKYHNVNTKREVNVQLASTLLKIYYRSIGLWWSLNFQRQLKCSDYFVIRLYCVSVFGLDCYQCNSTLDSNCQDRFNHDQSINPIRSTKCTVYNSRYCIKITGVWGGKILPIQIIYIQDLEVHAYFLQTTIE